MQWNPFDEKGVYQDVALGRSPNGLFGSLSQVRTSGPRRENVGPPVAAIGYNFRMRRHSGETSIAPLQHENRLSCGANEDLYV